MGLNLNLVAATVSITPRFFSVSLNTENSRIIKTQQTTLLKQ